MLIVVIRTRPSEKRLALSLAVCPQSNTDSIVDNTLLLHYSLCSKRLHIPLYVTFAHIGLYVNGIIYIDLFISFSSGPLFLYEVRTVY